MKILGFLAGIALAQVPCAVAQSVDASPDIETIMSRVAINQATSQDMRKSFVYTQKQLLRMFRSNGKLAREERREYTVLPDVRGVKKELGKFEGKYQAGKQFISYDKPGYTYKAVDLDGDLIEDLSEEMTNDGDSRDGIAHELFPLTNHQQLRYTFKLKGAETYRGHEVFRVSFEPKPHQEHDFDDAVWRGEALIDANEYEPVWVSTSMAMKIPEAVKILLGTDIKGLGFTVSYEKQAEGIWFPVSYGGEFEVRGLFFYKRTITVSMTNTDFRRTDVTSNVAYDTERH